MGMKNSLSVFRLRCWSLRGHCRTTRMDYVLTAPWTGLRAHRIRNHQMSRRAVPHQQQLQPQLASVHPSSGIIAIRRCTSRQSIISAFRGQPTAVRGAIMGQPVRSYQSAFIEQFQTMVAPCAWPSACLTCDGVIKAFCLPFAIDRGSLVVCPGQ
jgi:hypothetical protein